MHRGTVNGGIWAVVAVAFVGLAVAQKDQPVPQTKDAAPAGEVAPDPAAVKAAEIERGKYIANNASLCVVCHSPKDEHGDPVLSQAFQGGVIPAKATYPEMTPFASHAPSLGPLAGGASDDVVYLLQTGIWRPTGKSPNPPMPPFRLTEEDAKAVVAYLQSLQISPRK